MKPNRLVGIILCASLLWIPLSVFANSKLKARPNPRRFCVQCAFNRVQCRTCTSGNHSIFCDTFNCGACEEVDDCSGGPGGILEVKQLPSGNQKSLKLPTKLIRDIGAEHARFAITLAEINEKGGLTPGKRRVYWTPVKLSSSDVEAFLNKGTHTRFFKQYDDEVRRLNALIQKGELSDIVYAISIQQTEEGSWSLNMQVEDGVTEATGDPVASTLEISVVSVQPAQATVGQHSSRKKFTWKLQ
jgi:hypothetical protein